MTPIESKAAKHFERMLDRLELDNEHERQRVYRALHLAAELLEQHHDDRVQSVVVDYPSWTAIDRRLPVLVSCAPEDEVELERELAEKVLGPVFGETRVSMPMSTDEPDLMEALHAIGLLYPLLP